MRKIFAAFSFFCLITMFNVCLLKAQEESLELSRARRYFKEYQFERALKYYDKVIESKQNDAEIFADMGEAYYGLSDAQTATDYFKKALNIRPDYVRAYYNLIVIHSKLGYDNAAYGYYYIAMGLKGDSVEDYYYRGRIINEFDKTPQDAIPFFKKAINVDPGFLRAYYELAYAYLNTGEPDKGKEVIKEAVRRDMYSSEAQMLRGILYHGTKKAIDYYLKAVEYNPFNIRAQLLLADAYEDRGDYENAKNYCYEAIRNNPYHPDAYYKLAGLYSKTGEYHFSRINMKKALELYQSKGDQKMSAAAAEFLVSNSMYFKEKGKEKEEASGKTIKNEQPAGSQ